MSESSPSDGEPLALGSGHGTLSPFLQALQSNDLETPHPAPPLRCGRRSTKLIGYRRDADGVDRGPPGGASARRHQEGPYRRRASAPLFNDALAPWKIETGKIDLLAMRRDMLAR